MFWFAIHLEDLKLVQTLLEKEYLLKQLVACALLSKYGEQNESEESGSAEGREDDWNINSQQQDEEES